MEWLIGIYVVIGVFKGLGRILSDNPTIKPLWMMTERNPIKLAALFTAYCLFWPFAK